jgi:protein phosphatase
MDPQTEKKISWTGMTHKGRFRKNNEDAFLALSIHSNQVCYLGRIGSSTFEKNEFVFAVSDGMGGAKSGEFASKVAVDKITKMVPNYFNLNPEILENKAPELLKNIMLQTHQEMHKLGRSYEECFGMGATLSLCWFTRDLLILSHVGDSRIYKLPQGGGIHQISKDHTHAGWLHREGKINEREARQHPEANHLQQVLGGKTDKPNPQTEVFDYQKGDKYLLCSDGIVDGIWNHNLETIIREPSERFKGLDPSQRLVKEALEESGRDNLTALVIEF